MPDRWEYGDIKYLYVDDHRNYYTFDDLINAIEKYNGYSIDVISPNILKVTDRGGFIHYLIITIIDYYSGPSLECSVCKLVSNKYIIGRIDTSSKLDTKTYKTVGFDLQGNKLTDGQISKLKILGLI